jgi:hypothetical protein
MQRIVLAALVFVGSVGSAIAGTLEVYIPPQPPNTVPAVKTLVQAIDIVTGGVAFSQLIDGTIQSAALSDRHEAAFSVAKVGTSIFHPQTMLFVQTIGEAHSPAALTTDGPMWSLGISDARLAWKDNESIKVRNRASGDTTSYGNSSSSNVQMSENRLLWHNWNALGLNQYHVSYFNLDTGQDDSRLFWNRAIQSLTLPRHHGTSWVPNPMAISNGQVYQDSGFGFDGGSLVHLYKDSFTPFKVVSLKSNGAHLAFKDETVRMIDPNHLAYDRLLWLKNGDQLFQLAGPDSGEYVLGPNAVAWRETTGGVDRLLVRDIPSGQTTPLSLEFGTFQLWDVNSRYVLVTGQVVPEPASKAMLALGALLANRLGRGRLRRLRSA